MIALTLQNRLHKLLEVARPQRADCYLKIKESIENFSLIGDETPALKALKTSHYKLRSSYAATRAARVLPLRVFRLWG